MRNSKLSFGLTLQISNHQNFMKNILRQFLIILSLWHLKFMQKICQKNYYRLLVMKPRYNVLSKE